MAKRHIHVDATSSAPKRLAITNWELCVLCQEDTGTALQHPYAAKGKPGIGYKSIADHLTSFNELGHMPMNVDIEQLNDGDGIEATLMRHQAGWHKACRLKFSQLKLDRLQEKSEEGIDTPSSVHTRSNQNTVELAIDKCFFCNEPESDAVPPSLMALVNMILDGPNIKHQSQVATASTRAALSISQLLIFNSVKNARGTTSLRHQRDRETPLPVYVAMKIHATTRKRTLVDVFSSLGMCVAYDRLLQLSSDLGNAVCEQFLLDGVVCPPKMRKGLLTMGAVDNLDHDPSSTTSKDSFHGTGISLIQLPSLEFTGEERDVVVTQASSTKVIAPLPEKYTSVLPAALKTKDFIVPAVQGCARLTDLHVITEATKAEWKWLDTVMEVLQKQTLEKTDWISWSAYHANIQATAISPAAINALLPLFLENAHSVAMIKHSMIIVKDAIQHLNPGQVLFLLRTNHCMPSPSRFGGPGQIPWGRTTL